MAKSKKRFKSGFAVVEALLIIVIIGIIGGVGYWVMTQRNGATDTATEAAKTLPTSKPGTLSAIDQLAGQDSQTETNIGNQYDTQTQTTAQSSNAAASNLGDAYNETNF